MAFVSSFSDVDQSPDKSKLDPETAKMLGTGSNQSRDSQDDIDAVNSAINGDSTLINRLRNQQKPTSYEEGVSHIDKHVKIEYDGKDESILVRHYFPENCDPSFLPLVINLHGGGWCYSSVENRNQFCSKLARDMNVEVVSVNYTLSPEAKTGQALNECFAVWNEYTSNRTNPNRKVFLCGDSAGGNIASCMIFKIKENNGILPNALLLLYPVTDLVGEYETYKQFGNGFGLDENVIKKYYEAYVRDPETRKSYYYSPIYGDLSSFPPTLIIGCQFDVLRGQVFSFAKKLEEYKIPVKYICVETSAHGFLSKPNLTKLITIGHKIIDDFLNLFIRD